MFTLTRESALTPTDLWLRVASLGEHTAVVPLTTTTADPGDPAAGWNFTVRTSVGPVHFDDTMVVEAWEPPREWRVRKTGPLSGWARAVVTPYAGGSRLTWTEELWFGAGFLQRVTTRIGDKIGPILFARVVDRLVAVDA